MQAGLQDGLAKSDAITIEPATGSFSGCMATKSENRGCEATEKQRSCGFELVVRVYAIIMLNIIYPPPIQP